MKKNLIIASVVILVSCNSNQPAETESSKPVDDSTAQIVNFPYNIQYSSKFVIDNPKNGETILTLWKDYDNGNFSAHKDLFADTVEAYLGDGSRMRSVKDSVIAAVQNYRNTFSAAVDRVDAVIAVKSTDKNENWVLVWGTETDTHKNGKIDSVNLQETWRLNKNGKADLIYQFTRPAAPPKK